MMSLLFTAHPVCVEFFNFSSNGSARTLGCNNSVNGVAPYSLLYPNDTCAYAYNATVLNCTDGAARAFNYTLSVLDGNYTYINLNNMVATNTMVLNQPVFNVSCSFTAFNVSSRVGFGNTTVSANVSACQYLLVKNASFPTNSTAYNVASDVNLNGKIDMFDVGFVSSRFGKTFPDAGYDYHADLNGDLKINMYDFGVVVQNFSKNVTYVQGSFDYRSIAVDFNVSGSLTRRFLDGRGFVDVPSGASRFNMSHWGIVDFLNSTWQSDICARARVLLDSCW